MLLKRFIAACAIFSVSLPVKSQSSSYVPAIIPKTPHAAELTRFLEYPVDYSTGIPDIEIPLYTIDIGSSKVPISLRYHAGGIKVADVASFVGLGWSLSTGGFISKTVLGNIDQANVASSFEWGFRTAGAIDSSKANMSTSTRIWEVLDSLNINFKKVADEQTDRIEYSFPGHSGVMRKEIFSNSYQSIPYAPIKFNETAVEEDYNIYKYKVVDENGDQFFFETREASAAGGSALYLLDKMQSADLTDSVKFYYQNDSLQNNLSGIYQSTDKGASSSITVVHDDDAPVYIIDETSPSTQVQQNVANWFSTRKKLPSRIETKYVSINLYYEYGRADFNIARLSEIKVRRKVDNHVLTDIKFYQSYFGSATDLNQRLRLDSIIIGDSLNTAAERYSLKYNQTPLPPYYDYYYSGSSENLNYYEDFWGYYNGQWTGTGGSNTSSSHGLIPQQWLSTPYPLWAGYNMVGNRYPDSNAAKACILEDIIYPTGGSTHFDFESNMIECANAACGLYEGDNGVFGGLRIRKITHRADSGAVQWTKEYKYELGAAKPISRWLFQYDADYEYHLYIPDLFEGVTNIYSHRITLGQPLIAATFTNGSPLIYSKVTEFNGTESQNAGKTEFEYEMPEEYVLYDSIAQLDAYATAPRFLAPYHYDFGNYQPMMRSKTVYKNVGGNTYRKVYQQNSVFDKVNERYFNTGVKVDRKNVITGQGWDLSDAAPPADYPSVDSLTQVTHLKYFIDNYQYNSTVAKQYNDLPVESRELFFHDTFSVAKVTSYRYDTTDLLPRIIMNLDSRGDTIFSYKYYPKDLVGGEPYDSMVSRNILTPVVEDSTTHGADFIQLKKTKFGKWYNGYYPFEISTRQRNASLTNRISFDRYSLTGRILQMTPKNDSRINFIWGYNDEYPIAKVVNSDSSSIAYSSFECEEKGGWSYSGVPQGDVFSPTGVKTYPLSTGSVTKSGMPNDEYIVSYWAKPGPAVVNGNSPSFTGKTINGWTYYENFVTGTSVSVSGSVSIDELRLYPKSAQMTTYAYIPSIGIQSECSVSNDIQYYEYDNRQRLSLVRDKFRNVIRRICYSYDGQVGACNYYESAAIAADYYSQNCSSGQTPEAYSVSVPAGMFTSYISQTAADDSAAQYAQQQANLHGTCATSNINVVCTDDVGSAFTVQLHNNATGVDYYISVSAHSEMDKSVPPGNYDITMIPGSPFGYFNYDVGCGYSDAGNVVYFYSVDLSSSCNTIYIY